MADGSAFIFSMPEAYVDHDYAPRVHKLMQCETCQSDLTLSHRCDKPLRAEAAISQLSHLIRCEYENYPADRYPNEFRLAQVLVEQLAEMGIGFTQSPAAVVVTGAQEKPK